MQANAKRYIWNFSIFSAGYVLLGILLFLAPEQSKGIVCIVLGIVAVVMGIVRIALHFAKDDLSRAFRNDIPIGVTMVLAGIYFFARPDDIWGLLPIILGFAIIYDSIIKLQHSFDLRRTGFVQWWGVLAAGLATAVLGALLILRLFPADVQYYYWGVVLIVDGIVNIATIIIFAIQLKKAGAAQKADIPVAAATPPAIVLPQEKGK